jgi:hypothetical protein
MSCIENVTGMNIKNSSENFTSYHSQTLLHQGLSQDDYVSHTFKPFVSKDSLIV